MKPPSALDIDSPLYPPLASYMQVDLVANANGSIWVLHNKPLPALIKWADYDPDAATVTLAMETGKTQELGVKVPETLTVLLKEATQLRVMLMENKNVIDFTVVPLNTISSV